MALEIEQLEVKITSSSSGASKSINTLIKRLDALKTALDFGEVGKDAVTNLNSISTALKGIGEQTAGIKSTADAVKKISSAASGFKNLTTNTKTFSANLTSISGVLTNTTSKLKSMLTSAITDTVSLIAKVTILKSAISKIYSFIQLSNKYVEDYNLFTVALGEYADEAERYANKVSELMGIDPAQWMRNQGVFNTIIKGFGVAGDRAYTMSQQLTQLGYDLSSFYNIDVEEAMTKLTSGISGELEPLRRLGYDLSVARLEQDKLKVTFSDSIEPTNDLEIALDDLTLSQEALNRGITKSVSDMTQAEKAQLRYFAIMTQVTDAQGDMSRTLEAPANQLRVLSAQVTMFGREVGNILIPALNAALPYIIATTKALRDLASWLASLANYKMPEIDYSGSNTVAQIEDIEDAWDGASKKAKEFKKFLLGIDELNIIPSTNPSGRGNEGDNSAGWRDFDLPTYDFIGNASQTRVNDIYEKIKSLFTEHKPEEIGKAIKDWIVGGLDRIPWNEIQAGAHTVGEKVAKFLNGLFSPSTEEEKGLGEGIGGAVGGALGTVGKLIGGFFENAEFDKWAESLGQFISKALEGVNIDIDSLFGDEGLGGWLGGEIKALKDNPELLAALSIAAVSLGTTFGKKFFGAAFAGYAAGSGITRLIEAWSGDEHYEGGFFSQMADIKESLTDGSYKKAIEDWGNDIVDGWNKMFVNLTPEGWLLKAEARIRGMDDDFDSILEARIEIIKHDLNYINTEVTNSLRILTAMVFGAAENISDSNERVRQKVLDVIVSIKEKFHNAWDDFKLVIDSIKSDIVGFKNECVIVADAVSRKFETFGSDVRDFLQPILDLINNIKSGFEAITRLDFSSLGGKFNLSEGGTGLIDIFNRLLNKNSYATGGFPEDGLFFANSGEMVGKFSNGRTAVANNDQIVAGISEGVRGAVLSALSSSGIVEAVMSGKSINIDGREIMNVVVNQNNRAINRTGVSPIRT